MAKGEYYDDAHIPYHVKRKEIIQRIHEWERFEANCQVVRELDNDKVLRISELQKKRRSSLENCLKGRMTRQSSLRKAKSLSCPNKTFSI
jgi:hypothetical protein